jgi:hypothetical protein
LAALATQAVARAGLQAAYVAPSASDTFVPDNYTFYVAKVGTTATTFTFAIPTVRKVHKDLALANVVVGPITSHDVFIGPFPADIFADPTASGQCTVTSSQQVGVTVGVFRIDPS